MCPTEASELRMNVEARREQVTVSSQVARGIYLAFDAPSTHWLWIQGLAEPCYGFSLTCKYPEGYTTCQETMLKYPFVILTAL